MRRTHHPHLVLVATISFGLAGPTVLGAEEIGEWSDAIASALVKKHYRETMADERIVAIRCPDPRSTIDDLASVCSALRFELAETLTRRHFDVVEPRDGFDAVATWDHVDCGRNAAPEYLGWNVIEIRMTPGARKRDPVIGVEAVEITSGTVLHEADLDRRVLGALERSRPSDDESDRPELVISRRDSREEAFASHLADRLVCALKDLPEKSLLDGVRVAGAISSPAHFEWTHDVAAALIVHLNRVLRSGYVRGDTSTLEIDIESLGLGSFRVMPSIVRIDAATGESVTLVDGGEVCPGRECVIEIVGFLSPLLGDLRVFGDDETALRTYLARRALEPHLESVESDEPAGRIVGQTPDAGTLVDGIPRGALVVRIAADRDAEPRRETIALANLESEAVDLQETLLDIGRELGISTEAVSLSLQAVRRGGRDAAYLERIISTHDPRRRDDADLPHSWRAWYELAEPAHAPNFSGSAINGFAREVADALWDRLERAVLDDEAPR